MGFGWLMLLFAALPFGAMFAGGDDDSADDENSDPSDGETVETQSGTGSVDLDSGREDLDATNIEADTTSTESVLLAAQRLLEAEEPGSEVALGAAEQTDDADALAEVAEEQTSEALDPSVGTDADEDETDGDVLDAELVGADADDLESADLADDTSDTDPVEALVDLENAEEAEDGLVVLEGFDAGDEQLVVAVDQPDAEVADQRVVEGGVELELDDGTVIFLPGVTEPLDDAQVTLLEAS